MSERLTDEDLDELDNWGTSPNPSTTRLVVKEIRALRARVAKLEVALREIGREQSAKTATVAADKFQSIARTALMDTPQ
jgi:hypothetical protein